MPPPVIGITGRQASVRDDFPETLGHLRSDVYITAYAQSVARAGGLPVWLTREAEPDELAASLDGVLIAGGQDIDPRRYGGVPGRRSTILDPARDQFEIDLVLAAIRRRRPVLGICRGTQLINVALGGSLINDLAVGDGASHAFLGYPAWHRSHGVSLRAGSRLAEMLGENATVNSYHHQCVDRLGDGLVATAFAPDGVIEAIELPSADVIGVQWHPEMLHEPDPVFHWLTTRSSALDDSEIHRAIA
jgi:putative glutamine amidotransferase